MHIEHMNKGTSKASLHVVEELPLAAVFFLLANASLISVYDSIEQESVSPNSNTAPFHVLLSIALEINEVERVSVFTSFLLL